MCIRDSVLRWHERVAPPIFVVGMITTAAVTLAWVTNLIAKPQATLFGGGLTLVGVAIALSTHALARRRGFPVVFPYLLRADRPPMLLSPARRIGPCAVLAVLPDDSGRAVALSAAAVHVARGGPIVFLYRGKGPPPTGLPHLMEIVDPYLNDHDAQEIFGRAERAVRGHGGHRKYLYVGKGSEAGAVTRVREGIQPEHTLVVEGDDGEFGEIPPARVRRIICDSVPVRDYAMGP